MGGSDQIDFDFKKYNCRFISEEDLFGIKEEDDFEKKAERAFRNINLIVNFDGTTFYSIHNLCSG